MSSGPSHDSKQSEKEYLRRASAGDWERFKPFSPPGTDTLHDSAALIQDFAVALSLLGPSPSDLILDLGAGACWCTDWLARLNLRTVSVDISHDMLRLGRSRVPPSAGRRLAVGDMEYLPFASGSFDKAVCLSALHHVPSIERALGEIARVLAPHGVALFSEPGAGHSAQPGSVAATQDFGVLEQDILVVDMMETCRRAGFVDVRLKPMSYVISGFDLTLDQWMAWSRLSRRKRPFRAAEKLWRATLELVGLGKRDQLFEEAFAMGLVRLLRGAMEDHPVVVASKSAPAIEAASRWAATIKPISPPIVTTAGEPVVVTVEVKNVGSATWPAAAPAAGSGHVQLGLQLLDQDRRLIDRDYARARLASDVAPGQQVALTVSCAAPESAGTYAMKLDMVAEGLTWFEPQGSATVTIPLVVNSSQS